MSRISITSAVFILPVVLAACGSDTPEPIRQAPIYNKMGEAGCIGGDGRVVFPQRPVPGTVDVQQPPLYLPRCEELCDDDPIYDAQGVLIDPCLPLDQRRPERRDDRPRTTPDPDPDPVPVPSPVTVLR